MGIVHLMQIHFIQYFSCILFNMTIPLYAIIVAGGSGSRMLAAIPKQFLELAGNPMLMHTIDVFKSLDAELQILLVLPQNQIKEWAALCEKYVYNSERVQIVVGGNSRFESVGNGLAAIDGDTGLVAVHDGVRPLVTADIITESFKIALMNGNAVAAVALKDSIRQITNEGNKAVNRNDYQLIQTPQTFAVELLKTAYKNANPITVFTDDASVVESIGEKINLFNGSYDNIKITTPEDLMVAEAIIKNRLAC